VPVQTSREAGQHKSLSRHVSDDLLARIGAGEFSPGDRLPTEVELMDEYSVGRNAVREGIQGLVALGMLEVRPRRGAVVLAATPERILPLDTLSSLMATPVVKDLYDVRLLLECRAAELAAERRQREEVLQIKEALARFVVAFETGAPVWQADLEFHHAVATASGNEIIPRILEAAHGLLASARRATNDVPDAVRDAVVEHGQILAAIERGDAQAAAAAMRVHIEHGVAAYELTQQRLASAPGRRA
jgi:DNA-binding FadR family transcriptional regulator